MSFLQRLEMMQWPASGYRGGSSDSGGSGSDSGGYEEAAYGGPREPTWTAAPQPSSSDSDNNSGIQYNPNVGAPTFDAPSDLEQNMFLGDSSGGFVTDSQGNRIQTPVSQENFEEQQRREEQETIRQAEEARRAEEARLAQLEREQGILNQGFDYFDPLVAGGNLPLIEDYFDTYKAPRAGLAPSPVIESYFDAGGDSIGTAFSDYVTLSVGYGDDNVQVLDGNAYAVNPSDEFATYWNNLGKAFAGQGLGSLAGGFLGDLAFSLAGSNRAAVEPALYADAIGGNLTKAGASKLFGASNILKGADGQLYINDTLTNPFTGESTTNIKSLEQKTQETIDFNQRQQQDQSRDDYDVSQVASVVSGSTGNNINWRDYRGDQFSMSPSEIINAAIGGVDLPAEVVDAARFTGRIAGGDDPLQAAVSIYGDNLTAMLPEGYDRPTQAAVRIGLGGENRVAVLGDIYGQDFNLDNPIGKGSLKAAEVYDQTGDTAQALGKGIYTYINEGGTLPEFDVDGGDFDFLGDVDLPDFNIPYLSSIGVGLGKAVDFLGNVDWPDLGSLDIPSLRDLGVDLNKINFDGATLDELNITLPEAEELGIDLGSLGLDIDFDFSFPSLAAGQIDIIGGRDDDEAVKKGDDVAISELLLASSGLSNPLLKS